MKQLTTNTAFLFLGSLILLTVFLSGCKEEETDPEIKLNIISTYSLSISEPSGLALSKKPNELIVVSDESNEIYRISTDGTVLQSYDYAGNDLEGVTYNINLNNLFILEESSRQVFRIDTNGIELSRFPIDIYYEEPNHGPEGISYNPETNNLYVVTEKNPGRLIEINLQGEIINNYSLSFAEDYSALYFDPIEQKIWILSDESKTLTRCDLTGKAINKYSTGITKGEGLVVDPQNKMVYIVSDQESKMYVLSLP